MDYRKTPEFTEVASFLEKSRGLPPGMLSALVGTESSGNPNAVSPVGARGLTQFMPETAKQYNVDVNDPLDSLRGTADYLQDLIHKYDGNVRAALSHYNGGGHNAQFQVSGKAPDASKVSPQNFAVNQKYVSDIMSKVQPQQAAPDYVAQVNAFVADLARSGASPNVIINQLMQEPATADLVSQGMKAGDSPEQIVAKLGGAAYAPIAAARAKVDAQSFGTNLVQGGAQTLGDAAMAARQLGARVSGNEARLGQLQAEQRAAEADPTRQALSETAGAKVADFGIKAAPYVAAAVATGGSSIPVMAAAQGAAGAAEGLLTPTTEEGQLSRNVISKALLGGGTAGAAGLASKGATALGGRLLARDPEAAAKLAIADKMGLTPTASMVSKRMAAVTEAVPAARATVDDLASKDLTRQLLKGIGQDGTEITPALIQQAQKSIYAEADDLLGKIAVPRSTAGIGTELKSAVSEYEKNTLKAYRSGEVKDVADEVLNRIKTGNMTGAGLVEARKNILANAFQTDGTTRQALKKIANAIDNHIETIAPNASAAIKDANQKWANLQVIENVFKRTNGQPLTPAQLATSVKVTGRDLFETGRAPYQELADAALKLYGKNSTNSLSGILRRTVGSGDGMLGAASILEPTVGVPSYVSKKLAEKLLTKRATSIDRALIERIANSSASNAPSRHYIAKALGAGTALNYDE